MAALSANVDSMVMLTSGRYKNQYGTVKVRDGHKVVVLEKDGAVIYGVSNSMVRQVRS